MSQIDPSGTVSQARLYRQHCCITSDGSRVKDLSLMGRELHRSIIIDHNPEHFSLQPRNGIRVSKFAPACEILDDGPLTNADASGAAAARAGQLSIRMTTDDRELADLLPLMRLLAQVDSVYAVLDLHNSRQL
jgi:TFIIF-interacting CTD phosphatase-like protein